MHDTSLAADRPGAQKSAVTLVENVGDPGSIMAISDRVTRLENLKIEDVEEAVEEEEEEEEENQPLHMPQPRPRPTTSRSSTDPTGTGILLQPSQPSSRPRNRSPYSRSHLRSSSSSNSLTAPAMTRSHSLPSVISPTTHLSSSPSARASSPLRSPARVPSPFSLAPEDTYPQPTASRIGEIESISEDSELNLTPRAGSDRMFQQQSLLPFAHGYTFPRSRRRPTSPLHHVSKVPFGGSSSTPTSSSSSPVLSATKFNESYPPGLHLSSSFSSSSMPSTPTSARSRSPSISSLETIPDSPDAEEAALEADKLAKLDAAAKAAEGGGEVRRSSLDVPGERRPGFGFGGRDKRKRWSVCGAERRGDLDLETIWED
ncbi:hypothetical protein W97_03258 [Coniosporium apollinis CBS 100218]|uniref:Basic proline-rich protein n=2 Tax=Coniosporium apollinis TaxID=61459 RepID=R7YQA2_CONA1|nr:uncharacterized protein W97_03258 [Coniosporium apollinis CBS 100218]EON64028.1 hypothetical protein W97_03258 [Coniosporium apollinis CBS 100218]